VIIFPRTNKQTKPEKKRRERKNELDVRGHDWVESKKWEWEVRTV
jgi:hypothetical protein